MLAIGYQWLAAHYGISPVQAFRIDSAIGRSRSTVREDGYVHETYAATARPIDTLAGHLAFALKHEGVHLEFLARLFLVVPVLELEAWIVSEPTGQYARRCGFFFEYLTDQRLNLRDVEAGNYVNALDGESYLTAVRPVNVPRWRVRDNLPGSRAYCPMVMRSARIRTAEQYDCARQLAELETEFGADLLLRSVVWLTIKESRASFAIEHEERHTDRVRRFASVMEQRCGKGADPLLEASLGDLQSQILGAKALRYGLRRSPVFVGETDGYTEVVYYIAPHWDDVPGLLAGLRETATRTNGASSIVRAAVLSFGFVYIHPMSDGNGRISRFLINDVLRRDGAVPSPFILPVSATITGSVVNRRGYDQVLDLFSRPLMRQYAEAWSFGPDQVGEDGVRSNLRFDAYIDALPAWRYPDLTDHAEYLAEVLQQTIEQEMRKEAGHLRSLRMVRERVKQVIEGPDADIDRIVRSVRENNGQVSNKLKSEFPLLGDTGLADQVVAALHATSSSPDR